MVSLLDRVVASIIAKLKVYFEFSRLFVKDTNELEALLEEFESAARLADRLN